MATVERPTETLPEVGSALDPRPITNYITNILTFLESTNLDEANVDLSGTDGIVGKSTAQTITGTKTFETAAAADGTVHSAPFSLKFNANSNNSQNGEGISFSMVVESSTGVARNAALFEASLATATNAAENSLLKISGIKAGTARSLLELGATETVFNQSALDIDFRIESQSNANMFFVDASTNQVGVGTSSPDETFQVVSTAPTISVRTATADGTAFFKAENDAREWRFGVDGAQSGDPFTVRDNTGSKQLMSFHSGGSVTIGDGALATSATQGFFYLPTMAGTPVGNPEDFTGRAACVIDTSGSKLWVSVNGSTWVGVTLS